MATIPKRFLDRAKVHLKRYQKVLEIAKSRDINESDTGIIVGDILTDILGYDKYTEVTRELAIRGTFCDLAIRVDGRLRYLIEVKSIGTELRDLHLRQAIDYGAREGIEWIILTNGAMWQAHRIYFEQPVRHEAVFTIDLLDPSTRGADLVQHLYLISKEAGNYSAIDQYWKHKEATSRYIVAQILLSDDTLGVVRRKLRSLFAGLKVSEDDIAKLMRAEVLKRDALEGERAVAADRLMRRAARKKTKQAAAESSAENAGHDTTVSGAIQKGPSLIEA